MRAQYVIMSICFLVSKIKTKTFFIINYTFKIIIIIKCNYKKKLFYYDFDCVKERNYMTIPQQELLLKQIVKINYYAGISERILYYEVFDLTLLFLFVIRDS